MNWLEKGLAWQQLEAVEGVWEAGKQPGILGGKGNKLCRWERRDADISRDGTQALGSQGTADFAQHSPAHSSQDTILQVIPSDTVFHDIHIEGRTGHLALDKHASVCKNDARAIMQPKVLETH